MTPRPATRRVIGWREWVTLPELAAHPVKAKIDTGARTSALHAVGLTVHEAADGTSIASFELHPVQRTATPSVPVSTPVRGFRNVRSSNGRTERRPVITTRVVAGDVQWSIEVTLTSRDEMGFRLLLGRAALKRRFIVDPARSYVIDPEPTSGAAP